MLQLVIFTGRTGTGKSTLASALRDSLGFLILNTTDIIRAEAARRGRAADRVSLQALGDILDEETGCRWPLDAAAALSGTQPGQPIAIDTLRKWPQMQLFRKQEGWRTLHVHLEAPMRLLEQRFGEKKQHRPGEADLAYRDADLLKDPADIRLFAEDADLILETARIDPTTFLRHIAAALDLKLAGS
jgi:RNase adaptor protein for sRNA GlmZ degradation